MSGKRTREHKHEKKPWPSWLHLLVSVFLAGCALLSVAYLVSIAALASGAFGEEGVLARIGSMLAAVPIPVYVLCLVYLWILVSFGKRISHDDVPIVLLAIVLSMLTVLGASIAQLKTISFFYASAGRLLFMLFAWASLSVAFYVCFRLAFDKTLLLLQKGNAFRCRENVVFGNSADKRWLLAIAPVCFLIGWLPYIVLAAPGTVSYDMTWMIQQFQGESAFTTHHPLAATLLYGAVFVIGELIGGSANAGVLAITILQTIAWIAICTLEMRVIRAFGAPTWFVVCSIVFFMTIPAFGTYCQYAVKDSLFAVAFVLYVSLFALYVKNPREFSHSPFWMGALIVAALLTGLLRNNGFYAVLLSLPFLSLLNEGWKSRLRSLVPLIAAIIIIPLVNMCLQIGLNASSGSVAEALSIPFQQTARYAVYHSDDVEDWEKDILDATIDYEHAAENYQWNVSDPIKNTYKGAPLSDYFRVWASQGLRHPGVYLDATIVQSYGYWYPETGALSFGQEGYCYVTSYSSAPYWPGDDSEPFEWYQWYPDIASHMNDLIVERLRAIPIFSFFINDGIYTWALLIELALLAYARKRGAKLRNALILLPCFVLLLTCIAGPLCGSVRYMLGIIAVFPLTAAATLYFVNPLGALPKARGADKKR